MVVVGPTCAEDSSNASEIVRNVSRDTDTPTDDVCVTPVSALDGAPAVLVDHGEPLSSIILEERD